MKHAQRAAIGAGFAILAAAGLAGSGAFACTREARLAPASGAAFIVAQPDQVVTVSSTSFSSPGVGGYGPINFEWLAPNGTPLSSLASITAPSPALPPGVVGSSFETSGTLNTTTLTFAVPASATTLPTSDSYWVRASQLAPERPVPFAGTVRVFIEAGHEPRSAAAAPAATQESGTAASSVSTRTATAGGQSAPATSGVVAAPTSQLAVRSSLPAPSAAPVAELTSAPATPSAGPGPSDNVTQPAMPEPVELPLWSGLKTSASPSSLLDGAQPAPTSSGSPAGVILLTMGLLALAGTGVAVGQRRLGLARAAGR